MPQTKTIVIDQKFSNKFSCENTLALMPAVDYQPEWIFPFEQQLNTTPLIVELKDKLSELFAEKVYAPKLGYSEKSTKFLYFGYGNGIAFLLADRLIRLNLLLKANNGEPLQLANVDYKYEFLETERGQSPLYFEGIETSERFNQWILCRLLPTLPKKKFEESKHPNQEVLPATPIAHFNKKPAPFLKRMSVRLLSGDLTLNKVISWFSLKVSKNQKFSKIFKKRRVPYYLVGPFYECFMMAGHFFWPFGYLFGLPKDTPKFALKTQPVIQRSDFAVLQPEIAALFRTLIEKSCDENHIPEESYNSLAQLISELLPTVLVEKAEDSCKWAISTIRETNCRTLFTYSPVGGPCGVLYNFACRELGIKILGTQHSAWGGYLRGGALVTEELMLGVDDYITFGWSNFEPGMSHWLNKSLVMPSPLLSHAYKNKSRSLNSSSHNNTILFCPGFVYRFPLIYNSFLRLDTLHIWVEVIENVLKQLAAAEINVVLKMYNNRVAAENHKILKRWLNVDSTFIVEDKDHDWRVRDQMFSGALKNKFSAIVWDMPAGGFTEAIASGIPTFSLWDESLIRPLPEAVKTIKKLADSGVLFTDGARLTDSLKSHFEDSRWYETGSRKESIDEFIHNYCRIDAKWAKKWRKLLAEYA